MIYANFTPNWYLFFEWLISRNIHNFLLQVISKICTIFLSDWLCAMALLGISKIQVQNIISKIDDIFDWSHKYMIISQQNSKIYDFFSFLSILNYLTAQIFEMFFFFALIHYFSKYRWNLWLSKYQLFSGLIFFKWTIFFM